MLLASFQPLYTKQEIMGGEHLQFADLYKASGYEAPVWCYGGSFTDIFLSALLSQPQFPEQFVLFETDDFIRIDKAGWYRRMRNGQPFDETLFNSNLPDRMTEFMTDMSYMADGCVARLSLLDLEDRLFSGKNVPMFIYRNLPGLDNKAWSNAYRMSIHCFREVSVDKEISDDDAAGQYESLVQRARYVFLHGMFPLFYSWVTGGYTKGFEYSAWLARGWFAGLVRDFWNWYSDAGLNCDAGALAEIFDRGAQRIATDPILLQTLQDVDSALDLSLSCPCGSGKALGDCHGRMYLDLMSGK